MIQKLRFENLTFAHEKSNPLFKNLDFDFPTNTLVWVNAENGSGKSSLLSLLAVLTMPQTGQFYINDENIYDLSFEEFLKYRLKIGYSFDYGGLLNNQTIRYNISLPLTYHKLLGPNELKARVDYYAERFGLEKFMEERPAHVPGRIRKMTALVRSLITHPEMLLMDDPTIGLTPDQNSALIYTMRELIDQGMLKHIYVSTFDTHFINAFDHCKLNIDEGRLYLEDTKLKKVVNI